MTTVEQVLDELRARGKRLPLELADQIFCAAVRLAVERPLSLRPRLLVLDEQEGLLLAPPPAGPAWRDRPERPGYVAPEVISGTARHDEPLALVYAAGALGYELLTGRTPPQPPRTVGGELSGPLAAVVRKALAVNRSERPPGLPALRAALETEETPLPPGQERARFAALLAGFNAATLPAPPSAASVPPAVTSAPIPPPPPEETEPSPPDAGVPLLGSSPSILLLGSSPSAAAPEETGPSPPDAGMEIVGLAKSVRATQAKLARLVEMVLEQSSATAERERMAPDLVAVRSEHNRTIALLSKREEELLARLASLEAAVRASQIGPRRFPSWWPLAVAAGGGALVSLTLVLALGGRAPAPRPSSHEEPAQPAPQAVEPAALAAQPAPQAAQPAPQAAQPAPAPPAPAAPDPAVGAPALPAPAAGPAQAALGEVSDTGTLAGAPALSGGLTAEQVRKKLEENRGALRSCIDKALRRDPNLRVRKIHVASTIAPSGQVTATEIDDRTVNQSPLGICLKRATMRIVFPSFAGEPFDVDIPIVVTAADQ